MKQILIILCTICIAVATSAQTPAIQWQKCLGGTQEDYARAISPTSDGGYIVTGYTDSNDGDVSGNHGNKDYWVVKLDNAGVIQWQKCLGGTGNDEANSISATLDGGYIVAGVTYSNDGDVSGNHGGFDARDAWVVKLDNTGVIQWQKCLGGTARDIAYSISPTLDSGYVVAATTGSNDGDVTGYQGSLDYWVVKLSSNGSIEWQKCFGGTALDEAHSISPTADGGYIVAGRTTSNNGDVSGNHGNSNFFDYWVVKLSSNGSIEWQKCLGGTDSDEAHSISPTVDGGYIVAGGTASYDGDVSGNHGNFNFYDYWVVKLDNAGVIQWQKCLGGTGYDEAHSISPTADGGCIVTGNTNSGNGDISGYRGNTDYWVVKLDNTGAIQWQKCLGGSNIDLAKFISPTADGGYVVVGVTKSNNLDVSGFHGSNFYDYWVVKLAPEQFNNVIVSPSITLSNGNMNTGQQFVISGINFTPNSFANLFVSNANGFNNSFTVNTSTSGTFTYTYATNNNMPNGQYTVTAVDSATGIYAPVKFFILTNPLSNNSKLMVLSPETNDTLFVNDTSQITWTDKLKTGQGYTVNGAQRNYKYTIEYSANNGANWQTLTTVQGWGYVNSIKTFHVPVAFTNIGTTYLVRVTDFYNNNNSDASGLFSVISQPSMATNIKAELYWDFSYANQNNALYGVAADGAARVFLVASKINNNVGAAISNVSVQISDSWNNTTALLGKVMPATQVSTYSTEANTANSLSATQTTQAFNRYWFWYVAPDNFVGSNPSDANSAYRYVNARLTITYSDNTTEFLDKQIKIVRPPLCFVHGLASDPSTWDNFRHDAFGYEQDFLNDSRFYSKRAIELDAKASFNTNAQFLTIGFNNPNSLVFKNSLQGVIKDLRDQGYAANRCDYIGHSMGGSVLRYALDHYSNHFYRSGSASNLNYKNYGRGYVNKTITINTPHNSSHWADILNRYTPDLTYGMRLALQLDYSQFPNSLPFSFIEQDNPNLLVPVFTVVDAVRNLQIDENAGGIDFGTTNLDAHLIGSDFFPGQQNSINNMIPQSLINVVDQAAEEVDFLNKFLELTIAKEQDQQLISDLIEVTVDFPNPVETALHYVERMADLWNTAMFIPESDLVVSVNSQLADYPRTAPNVTVFDNYIGHAFIRPVLNNIDAGNRVNDLLNSSISSNEFAPIAATSNKKGSPSLNSLLGGRSNTTVLSYRDTTKLKILSPSSHSQLNTDSLFTVRLTLSDTTNLISYKVKFQNKTYKLSKAKGITNLNLQVNSNLLDSNYIFAEAFFKYPDTSFFFFDTVLVNVTTTSPLIGFSSKQEVIYLNINQTKTPDYVSYYNAFATSVSNFSHFITASVANNSIVSFNPQHKSFTGIATGETFAIVSYKGLSDTIYFVVGENPLDSIATEIKEMPSSSTDGKELKLFCYPNPTKSTMTLDFEVINSGEVSIKIYDLLGHEQLSVLQDKREVGLYRTTFDTSQFPTGIYICELKNGLQRLMKRVVFMK